MLSCEKEKFPYSFLILLAQWHEFPAPKLTNFHIFIFHLLLNLASFSKSPYMTVHININYETGCIRKPIDVSSPIPTAKVRLFVTLVAFSH